MDQQLPRLQKSRKSHPKNVVPSLSPPWSPQLAPAPFPLSQCLPWILRDSLGMGSIPILGRTAGGSRVFPALGIPEFLPFGLEKALQVLEGKVWNSLGVRLPHPVWDGSDIPGALGRAWKHHWANRIVLIPIRQRILRNFSFPIPFPRMSSHSLIPIIKLSSLPIKIPLPWSRKNLWNEGF